MEISVSKFVHMGGVLLEENFMLIQGFRLNRSYIGWSSQVKGRKISLQGFVVYIKVTLGGIVLFLLKGWIEKQIVVGRGGTHTRAHPPTYPRHPVTTHYTPSLHHASNYLGWVYLEVMRED